ncbi:MAG: hypothetical protein XD81_1103 [Bacteroidetes bacterium 38_7]|nr:MAG: hypothetical protein XD81_1103 [Bacteroidetes bacterium 38_7]HAL64196.1 hypothetical protein [Bacteroidales bacterium]
MKHVNIHCDVAQANEIIDILEQCQISAFQILDNVKVKNRIGDPRMNNPIWPGYNVLIMTQIRKQAKYDQLIQKIKDYNNRVTHLDQLIMLEAWDLDTLIFE